MQHSSVTILIGEGRFKALDSKGPHFLSIGLQGIIAEYKSPQKQEPREVQVSWVISPWMEGPADLEIQVKLGWSPASGLFVKLSKYLERAMKEGELKCTGAQRILLWIHLAEPKWHIGGHWIEAPAQPPAQRT